MTDKTVCELVRAWGLGCRLVGVEPTAIGLIFHFEREDEARGSLTLTGQMKTNLIGNSLTVAPSVNVFLGDFVK